MKNLVLFGPPGAGKGTQSEKLVEKYGFVHISTGDLFRYHTSKKTELGKRVQDYMDNGMLVPDQVTIDMLQEEVNKHPEAIGFLFDGFPRTVPQAEALDAFMKSIGSALHYIIALDVTEEEVRKRIGLRSTTSGRVDDAVEKLEKRIKEYYEKTIHVLPYYEAQGRLARVHGIGDIGVIFVDLCKILDA